MRSTASNARLRRARLLRAGVHRSRGREAVIARLCEAMRSEGAKQRLGYLGHMSEARKANVEGAAYFVTLTVEGWIDAFTRKELVEELVQNIEYCQRNKGLEVYAYVIMPSHVHMVVRREGGLLSEWLRDFKSWTAKRLFELVSTGVQESRREWMTELLKRWAFGKTQNKNFVFWKKDSHPIELWSRPAMEQKIRYIHNNPVEAGIVTEPHHYRLSSAHPDGPLQLNGYLERVEGLGFV